MSCTTVQLVKGDNEILFTNVATNVNTSSIMVNATNGVSAGSVIFQNNYVRTEVPSQRVSMLQDSIKALTRTRTLAELKLTVVNKQIALLAPDRTPADTKERPVAETANLLDLIDKKLETYLVQKNKLNETISGINDNIAILNTQIREEQDKGVIEGGRLLIKLYATETGPSNITITYVTPNAGWAPVYDLIAENTTRPLQLYYKANVFQNSGTKWENVRLALSTGNPTEGIEMPVMTPWYAGIYVPQPVAYAQPAASQPQQNRTTYDARDIKTLATTEIADIATLTPGIYQAQRGKGTSIAGARKTGTLYIVDGVQVQNIGEEGIQSTMSQYVAVDGGGMNTTYDIEVPYTIPADANMHLVAIKKYDVPASFRHYAIPRLDKDAFLQAEIVNWAELDLMPAQANIFYDGTYVGQGYFDTRIIKDTMLVSLGRDKKVMVKRELDAKKRSAHTIGTNVRETYAYTINVRNTRKQPINMIVYDQMPLSNNNDLTIESKETGDGALDERTGFVKWTFTAAPNESRKLSLGYTLKYPK
ncbi:DUF4139 domain-containing protein [Nemorincola caseinilytica]|uniref:DUF4139 domain-containing protein n=2 Tax=Nemorincola caseinilytica TaxID=2054315 RepID=A0ABP8N826_9BACT